MWSKPVILFLIFLNFVLRAIAQDLSVVTSLEKDTAWIGEQFHFTVEVQSTRPLMSVVPLDNRLFPQAIEVVSIISDSARTSEVWTYYSRYLITGFDSGVYFSEAIPVLVNTFSRLDTLYTERKMFILQSPAVDTSAAIMDIREPINTPFIMRELVPYMPYAAGLLVLGILVLIWIYYFKKKKSVESRLAITLPPHIKALESLDRIKNQKLWQKGEVKEYYSQLSDTVRTYLEDRFQIPAMESVTKDILRDFKTFSWEDETLLDILEDLLQLSDLVKFAKEDPLPSDNEMNLNNAYIFVEKTKPVSTPADLMVANN